MELFLDGKVMLHCGDSREVLRELPDNSLDSAVMDPPYALVSIVKRFGKDGAKAALSSSQRRFAKTGAAMSLGPDGQPTPDQYGRLSRGFMGKQWDTGETAFAAEFWELVLAKLKPGAHLVAFSGTRTYHRMACAIEDAGFEIRDQLGWTYGSGFPKSHDISLAIDKAAGVEREKIATGPAGKRMIPGAQQNRDGWEKNDGREFVPSISEPATDDARHWQGWGTALKPAWEPIVLARKPISEKTVAANVLRWGTGALNIDGCRIEAGNELKSGTYQRAHDASIYNGETSGLTGSFQYDGSKGRFPANIIHDGSSEVLAAFPADEFGSAARFFYTAKADGDDRLGTKHPTVKPVDLMQWCCRLVTPPGGLILDAFAGTGTTGEAAFREGFRCILVEREPEYQADIRKRMALALRGSLARKRAHKEAKAKPTPLGGMFEE